MSTFDYLDEMKRKASLFGGDASAASAPATSRPPAAPAAAGGTSAAVPGAHSPAADTVLDERETYLANSASFDKKWEGDDFLARALARHRGEKVEEQPVAPELGAPKSERPMRSLEEIMAEVHAQSAPPKAPAAEPEAPSPAAQAGMSERDHYMERRAAMDGKSKDDDFLQRALERHRARKAGSSE
jgi:hypothetical protein